MLLTIFWASVVIVGGVMGVFLLALGFRTFFSDSSSYHYAQIRSGTWKQLLNGTCRLDAPEHDPLMVDRGLAVKRDKDGQYVWKTQRRISRVGLSHL